MIFIFILIFGVLFLFVNLRQVAPGNRGSILAGVLVVLLPVCFVLRDMYWACVGQAFLSVWLCESLLLYTGWWIFRLCRRVAVRRPMVLRTRVVAARVLLAASFVISGAMCLVGYFHNAEYVLREATVELELAQPAVAPLGTASHDTASSDSVAIDSAVPAAPRARNFTALFFSDLHLDPLSRCDKVERMLHEADSIKPDLILFGGDFADIHDSVLVNQGYDTLFAKFASAARIGALLSVAITRFIRNAPVATSLAFCGAAAGCSWKILPCVRKSPASLGAWMCRRRVPWTWTACRSPSSLLPGARFPGCSWTTSRRAFPSPRTAVFRAVCRISRFRAIRTPASSSREPSLSTGSGRSPTGSANWIPSGGSFPAG